MKRLFLLIVLALLLLLSISPAQAANYVLTPINSQGWSITPQGNATHSFVDTAPGPSTGAAFLSFSIPGIANADKFVMTSPFINQPVASFVGFSYDHMSTSAGANTQTARHFYINVYVDIPGGAFEECRYDFVNPNNSSNLNTWVTSSFTSATVPANPPAAPCTNSIAGMVGSTITRIVVNAGQSSASDNGLAGGFDNISLTTTAGTDTWDFEIVAPVIPPVVVPSGGDDWSDIDGGSNCYDQLLRRVERYSDGLSIVCFERITDPTKRPLAPQGYEYISATYRIEGFVEANRIKPTDPKAAKACWNTTSLATQHPVSIGYHYGLFDPVTILAVIPQPHEYFCVDFVGNGYLSLLSGSGAAITTLSVVSSPAEIPLSNCQVTTRAILNLRATPSLAGEVLVLVPYGESGTALPAPVKSADGQWYKVTYSSFTGWLNIGFLTLGGNC